MVTFESIFNEEKKAQKINANRSQLPDLLDVKGANCENCRWHTYYPAIGGVVWDCPWQDCENYENYNE